MVRILYFGRLTDLVGKQEENVDLPENIRTVDGLKHWLSAQYDLGTSLHHNTIKTMLNQKLIHGNASIIDVEEIGFLPPVGGG